MRAVYNTPSQLVPAWEGFTPMEECIIPLPSPTHLCPLHPDWPPYGPSYTHTCWASSKENTYSTNGLQNWSHATSVNVWYSWFNCIDQLSHHTCWLSAGGWPWQHCIPQSKNSGSCNYMENLLKFRLRGLSKLFLEGLLNYSKYCQPSIACTTRLTCTVASQRFSN